MLLQAYGQVRLSHPEYRERYWAVAKQLESSQGGNVLVLEALADWALQRKNAEGSWLAIRYLDGAIHQGATNPADFEELAELLVAANRQSDALKILQQGMQVIPYYAEFYRLSATVNFSANRKQEACEVVAKGVEKFPQDTVIRDLSKKCMPAQPASSD
jgi:predicted Zn-dependent protease